MSRSAHHRREGPGIGRVARRLLIRPGAIGDIICSLPALESLRAEYTEVWAPEAVHPLLPHFDRCRSIAGTGLDRLELGLADERLQAELASFDSIVSWYGANREEFRTAAANLPITLLPALPADQPAVEFYNAQARRFGAEPAPKPLLPFSGPRHGRIVIHPFSGSPRKNWPLENYRAVAASLGDVEWCAGPDEPLEGARRFAKLDELARWLSGARLYLGNDSGITHLAAAVGVPVIAIFQASDPRVWAPPGATVLNQPSVEQVLAEANRHQHRA